MITIKQARRILKMKQDEKNTLSAIALKADVDVKTARKYIRLGKMPGELKADHDWRTRSDPFEKDWDDIRNMLAVNPGLEAKTIFDHLNLINPGQYSEGQLRTLQRKIKQWRALEGPAKEVFFPQEHKPGELCESDFTNMNELNITINHIPFEHLIYHFVLTYSNWETGTVCYSESFESLSEGLQNALWDLGGSPKKHRTDRLSTAVHNLGQNKGAFTARYTDLLKYYGITGEKIQADSPNENGDVEQRHHRLKRAVEQALMLRGSRDFKCREDYCAFLKELFNKLNKTRQDKLREELKILSPLPVARQESCKYLFLTVSQASTIPVLHNIYSVHSRLIGEKVRVKAYIDHLEIWYAQKCVEKLPRLKGANLHRIDYRHIIDWLIRKPGAFENYRYKQEMFPTTRFRIAYDGLKALYPFTGHKKYLEILHLAAQEGESVVDKAIQRLMDENRPPEPDEIKRMLDKNSGTESNHEVRVEIPDINVYDCLLKNEGEACHA